MANERKRIANLMLEQPFYKTKYVICRTTDKILLITKNGGQDSKTQCEYLCTLKIIWSTRTVIQNYCFHLLSEINADNILDIFDRKVVNKCVTWLLLVYVLTAHDQFTKRIPETGHGKQVNPQTRAGQRAA